MSSIKDARLEGGWLSWVGATVGCLKALGVETDSVEVAGHSGYAFKLVIDETACVSGPTAFDWSSLLPGVWRCGRSATQFWANEDCGAKSKSDRTQKHFRAALELVKSEVAAGRPCVINGAYVPEFAIVVGVDGDMLQVESFKRMHDEPQPPIKFDELDAPGGAYVLAFPTDMSPKRQDADRDSIIAAALAMTHLNGIGKYATGWLGLARWIKGFEEKKIDAWGNSYNAACWAEARKLAHTFVGRVAQRNDFAHDELMRAAGALDRCASALGEISKRHPFPGKEPISESDAKADIEALHKAKDADVEAGKALLAAVVAISP